MSERPFVMDQAMRQTVHASIVSTCEARNWSLLACNVRTNHVHVVVSTDGLPEPAMVALKSWATRALRDAEVIDDRRRPWARGGSTRYLYTDDGVMGAIYYVNELQEQPRERER